MGALCLSTRELLQQRKQNEALQQELIEANARAAQDKANRDSAMKDLERLTRELQKQAGPIKSALSKDNEHRLSECQVLARQLADVAEKICDIEVRRNAKTDKPNVEDKKRYEPKRIRRLANVLQQRSACAEPKELTVRQMLRAEGATISPVQQRI
eukprot:COSAG05_NODE_8554_length_693_cov_3.414141_2_plen_156_part_00